MHNFGLDIWANDNFIINAEKLGVDLKEVDTAIVSHGHYDHGGGLAAFLEINKTAKVYLSESAFNENYSKIYESLEQYIGLDQDLKNHEQLVFIKDKGRISDNIFAFANVLPTLASTQFIVLSEFDTTHFVSKLKTLSLNL